MNEDFSLPAPNTMMPLVEWLHQNRHLRFDRVEGDSMEPPLRACDVVAVDTRQISIDGDRIYLIEVFGARQIRRCLRWPGQKVRISAFHPALRRHPIIVPRDDVIVLGTVVMHGRRV